MNLCLHCDATTSRSRKAGVTRRQSEALSFVASYVAENGLSPSYDEIAKGLGLVSRSSAFRLVMELEERGRLRTRAGRARSIVLMEAS